jgi:hypothetical protein
MAQAVINWTPGGGGNIASQEVQYRVQGTTNWTTAVSGLSASASTYTITNLAVNTIYEFRVISNCSIGGPIPSATMTDIEWFCPTITVTPTHNTITYSFSALGGSISAYSVQLLSNDLSTVIQTLTTVSGVFNSVSIAPSTSYKVRLTLTAGTNTNVCTPVSTATTTPPTCPIPTLTGANLGPDV